MGAGAGHRGDGLLPRFNRGMMSWSEIATFKPLSPLDGDDARVGLRAVADECEEATLPSPDIDPEVRLWC